MPQNMSFGSNGVDQVRSLRTILTQLRALMSLVQPIFCIDFHALTKWSGTPQNMSFGSNGVDEVRLLRKIPMQLCLANLCDNGTSSANFASTFVQ
jgi:hypothetical protein